MRARRLVLGLLWIQLLPSCGQGERERGDAHVPRELAARPLPNDPPPPPETYADHLAAVPSGASEQETLEALLYDYCGGCHGSDHDQRFDGAGMYYVDDIDRLIETGKIIPGAPGDSKLLLRMERGEMPPLSTGLSPAPPELIERLSQFIQGLPPR
ncbi:MAG TPA: hypothetical protein VFS67_15955 [Polyangiaceae bacterium]|nr:hypothetical protein [Polyangiaceae bacterium]